MDTFIVIAVMVGVLALFVLDRKSNVPKRRKNSVKSER
jgi:hypothetical protein